MTNSPEILPNKVLKQCPFCGADAYSENTITEGYVQCYDCKANIVCRNNRNDISGLKLAIKMWNRRVTRTKDNL